MVVGGAVGGAVGGVVTAVVAVEGAIVGAGPVVGAIVVGATRVVGRRRVVVRRTTLRFVCATAAGDNDVDDAGLGDQALNTATAVPATSTNFTTAPNRGREFILTLSRIPSKKRRHPEIQT